MEMQSAAMIKYLQYQRTSKSVSKPLRMHTAKAVSGFAAQNCVRVLLHKFTTKAHTDNMSWHVDDWVNSGADGAYRMSTIILPATRQPSDAISTEISGYDFKVPRGKEIWLPCNVLHRGVPTSDMTREGLMIEFIAAGGHHTSARNHKHADIKDWLYFSKNILMEHVQTPVGHASLYMV